MATPPATPATLVPPGPATEPPADKPHTLTPAELGMIQNWVQLADTLGLPKSPTQIYGLIFTSKKPISAQDCVDELKISRSSAGQGLKTLRDIGAIHPSFKLGARREAFVIESDLGLVMQGVMNGRALPAFDTFFAQLDALKKSLNPETDSFLIGRIQKLHRWRTKLDHFKRWLLQ